MIYNRCGKSGLLLPAISLGLWHSFGANDSHSDKRKLLRRAFDLGITHFDLANNYGPPPGAAEEAFGKILKTDFKSHSDHIVISTKAGYNMWDGPYGEWGSRKHLLSSLDQSLKRLDVDYVDIFYSHRFDPDTPLEETMGALDTAVRSGRALYVGISNYPATATKQAHDILSRLGTPCLIHQPRLNMLQREPLSDGTVETAHTAGMGLICFSPLAQGVLTDRYLNGVPADSRATHGRWFDQSHITPARLEKLHQLNNIAKARNQTLAQMSIAWLLSDQRITSALMGASKVSQIEDAVGALNNTNFSKAEHNAIETNLAT